MIINGNALAIPLADKSVQCVVTSPPYWGLRDYGISGQLGLEPTPEEYVANMVAVFREVRRVLRDDGSCWLNLGDSYWGGKGQSGYELPHEAEERRAHGQTLQTAHNVPGYTNMRPSDGRHSVIKPKDLVGIPWRVAFALQADGWYLRSDIIWSKPNPMPESVTDRPTKAHEYVFLLSKQARYFYDSEAIREPVQDVTISRLGQPNFDNQEGGDKDPKTGNRSERRTLENLKERYSKQGVWEDRFTGYELWKEKGIGRNRRTVWTIATQPYSGAHFATFPEALVEPCILAGTSERGCCPVCGKPWRRVVEATKYTPEVVAIGERNVDDSRGDKTRKLSGKEYNEQVKRTTLGFRPACTHDAAPIPCTVFDPFSGTATVGVVAQRHGRKFVGLELSLEYIKLARERMLKSNGYHVGRMF